MTTLRRILFVPLAANQATFYAGVGRVLRSRGVPCSFISFHEPSLQILRRGGFEAFSAYDEQRRPADSPKDPLASIAEFDVADVNLVISHETAAYEIRDRSVLYGKFARHLERVDGLLRPMTHRGERVEVVHELGGFLSVAAVFHASRRLGLRNTFIEPSFFRGRVFFTFDSYSAPALAAPPATQVSDAVRAYLDETLAQKRIVIPSKDTHHYRSASRKILSPYNVRRLLQKTGDKYWRRQREEFDHLGGHIARHVRMFRTARRLTPLYSALPREPFIYYPFHVPADVALTIRAPEYHDQCALVDYLARVVPPTHRLVVKEHPALIGAVDYYRVTDLLRRYDHVTLLRPTINNHDVLDAADAVVTVNSKSGAEALLRGRRVIALGDSFYRFSGLAVTPDGLANLSEVIRRTLTQPPTARTEIDRFFQRVYDSSYPGELYLDTPQNCELFASSLCSALQLDAVAEARAMP